MRRISVHIIILRIYPRRLIFFTSAPCFLTFFFHVRWFSSTPAYQIASMAATARSLDCPYLIDSINARRNQMRKGASMPRVRKRRQHDRHSVSTVSIPTAAFRLRSLDSRSSTSAQEESLSSALRAVLCSAVRAKLVALQPRSFRDDNPARWGSSSSTSTTIGVRTHVNQAVLRTQAASADIPSSRHLPSEQEASGALDRISRSSEQGEGGSRQGDANVDSSLTPSDEGHRAQSLHRRLGDKFAQIQTTIQTAQRPTLQQQQQQQQQRPSQQKQWAHQHPAVVSGPVKAQRHAATCALLLVALAVCYWIEPKTAKELLISAARAAVQLSAVGLCLNYIFTLQSTAPIYITVSLMVSVRTSWALEIKSLHLRQAHQDRTCVLMCALQMLVAAWTASRRAKTVPNAFPVSLISIATGTCISLSLLLALKVRAATRRHNMLTTKSVPR